MELEKNQDERMKNIMWSVEDILQQIKDIAQSDDSSTHRKTKST